MVVVVDAVGVADIVVVVGENDDGFVIAGIAYAVAVAEAAGRWLQEKLLTELRKPWEYGKPEGYYCQHREVAWFTLFPGPLSPLLPKLAKAHKA